MASKWPKAKIGDVAEVFDGPHATPSKTLSGPIFLGIAALNRGRLDLRDVEHLSEEDFVKWTRRVTPRPGDVVFSYETRLGEAAIIPNGLRCCLGRRMGLVRPRKETLDPQYFLYQYLGPTFQAFLRSRTVHGSTVDRIPLVDFPHYLIDLPPLEEQRAIAAILGTLDDKIELNRQINETLEAIVRAIFKSWFIDFDPVRAKASGESPKSICRRLGLTTDLLALFPNRLVDSEFGKMPEGWDIKPLDEIADYLNGLALQKYPPESELEWLPVIKIAQLKSGSTVGADRASHNLNPDYLVDDGDVLFSWSGSLEVDVWCGGRGALNQHLFKVISSRYPKWFFFYWTMQHLAHFRAIASGKAVTMGHIQRRHLTEALCAVPPSQLLERADGVIMVMFQYQIENRKQSRTISATRDALLPKLLSGEIRLRSKVGDEFRR